MTPIGLLYSNISRIYIYIGGIIDRNVFQD
jgi:hypothetical protein